MLDNNTQIVKFNYRTVSDEQYAYMRSLFRKATAIKQGAKFNPNSWERNAQGMWERWLTKHPELLVGCTLESLHGCSSLYNIDSQSADMIIKHLKPIVDPSPNFVVLKSKFVSSFSPEYFENLKKTPEPLPLINKPYFDVSHLI